jgi:hypothetical protein
LKRFLVLLFISLIITQELYTIVVYTAFKLNQRYIVENLCVMKDMAENNCQGSCQIKRKLNFNNTEESRPIATLVPINRNNNYKIEAFEDNLPIREFAWYDIQHSVFKVSLYTNKVISSIFHPPKV